MRRYLLCLAILLGLLTVSGQVLAAESREQVTLTLSNIWGGTRIPLMEAQLQKFQELYPWISVQNILGTDDKFEKDLVAIAGGSPPDVIMIDRVRLAELVDGGFLQPLDPFVKQDKLNMSIFYRSEATSCQYKGQTWSLPLPTASLSLLYYNRTLFGNAGFDPDGAPKTWDQMLKMGLKLQKISGDGRVEISGGKIDYFPRHRMAQMAYLNGATIFGPGAFDVNYLNDRTREAASFVADFVARVKPGGSMPTNDLAMLTYGEWSYYEYKNANPSLDVGIALAPVGPHGQYQNIVAAAWSYGIPVGAKHPYESWLLVKFLTTSEDAARPFVYEQGRPSPVIKFTQDKRYWQKNPYWSVIGDALNGSINIPNNPVMQKIINVDIKWYGTLINGSENPESALTKLQDEVNTIITTYKSTAKK